MQFVITEFPNGGPITNREGSPPTVRLRCRTDDDKIIVFWGDVDVGYTNVNALKDLSPPFVVEIAPEDLYHDERDKQRFGTDWNVNEGAQIAVEPVK